MEKWFPWIFFAVLVGVVVFAFWCMGDSYQKEQKAFRIVAAQYTEFYSGEHQLYRLNAFTNQTSEVSGSFFLLAGSIQGSSGLQQKISFVWLNKNGELTYSSIDLGHVRVKLDESVKTPTLQFNFDSAPFYEGTNTQEFIDKYVNYVVVTTSTGDWKMQVALP